jgi:hypothetical protein
MPTEHYFGDLLCRQSIESHSIRKIDILNKPSCLQPYGDGRFDLSSVNLNKEPLLMQVFLEKL